MPPRPYLKESFHFPGIAAAVLVLLCASFPSALGGDRAWKQLLVRFDAKLSEQGISTLSEVHGAIVVDRIPAVRVHVLRVPEAAADEVTDALRHNPNVEFAEADDLASGSATTNDPYVLSGTQWHLSRVSAPTAWDTTTGQSDVIVAVVDSGVQLSHPDLVGKLLPGYDFINNDDDPSDDEGHGTAVAGTVAAAGNNATGGAGVAYGCKILPVKALDATNYGSYSVIAKGITYAADHGARIINASICGTTSSFTLQAAVDYAWNKNAVVFAAAGNDATIDPRYPAACRNAVGVSALDQSNTRASFSSYGSDISLCAPGKDIWTTQMSSSYGNWWGTSFACPITAGVGALVLSVNPQLSNAELVRILEENADDLGPAGYDTSYGHGRVNAARCVAAAAATLSDATAPVAEVTSPAEGSIVTGIVNVGLEATDNIRVSKVELYIGGVLAGTSQGSPASFQWDTTVTENGQYALRAQAYDEAGNMGASNDAVVTVQNETPPDTLPPTPRITSPKPWSRVYSYTKVRVSTADDVGTTRVELYVNKRLYASSDSSAPVFVWKAPKAPGTYSLRAIAYDAAGNAGSSKVVKVVK